MLKERSVYQRDKARKNEGKSVNTKIQVNRNQQQSIYSRTEAHGATFINPYDYRNQNEAAENEVMRSNGTQHVAKVDNMMLNSFFGCLRSIAGVRSARAQK